MNKYWRISLTERCNYKCFFCHEEGLIMGKERQTIDFDGLVAMVEKGIELGYHKMTFTGGEPLYERATIIKLLKYLHNAPVLPDFTIGTNGVLIDEELIDAIKKYPGKFKFNFSLHAVDAKVYCDIIGIDHPKLFDKAMTNIKRLKEVGVPFKLNFVLLKGINNSVEYIKKILNFSVEVGATTVKFLELLITDKLMKFYDYYYEVDSIYAMLKEDLHFESKNKKRTVYRYKDTDLTIELQRCPCKIGCEKCGEISGRMITADGDYIPCFTIEQSQMNLMQEDMQRIFDKGDQIISSLANKYKNGSPLMIQNMRFIEKKREYYYKPVSDFNDEDSWISKSSSLNLKRHMRRTFKEIYYKNLQKKQNSDVKEIYKIYLNTYNEHTIRPVFSLNKISKDSGQYYNEITYLNVSKINHIKDLQSFDAYAQKENKVKAFELNWEIDFYEYENHQFSAGKNLETGKWSIMSEKPLPKCITDDLRLENISIALLQYLGFDYD